MAKIKYQIMRIKRLLQKKLAQVLYIRNAISNIKYNYIQGQNIKKYGFRGTESVILMPCRISVPQNVFLYEKTRIQSGCKIITYTGKFIMKKYSGASTDLTAITGNHKPTVGIPHYLLAISRVNDTENDIIIEEDVWVGANVTILSGVTIGRGSVIGACSVVTKSLPPYCVAVGNPTKIIASKFNIEQILKHEEALYTLEERMSKQDLQNLFDNYYIGKKSIGKDMSVDNYKMYEQFKQSYKPSSLY